MTRRARIKMRLLQLNTIEAGSLETFMVFKALHTPVERVGQFPEPNWDYVL